MVPSDFPAPTADMPVEIFAALHPARQVGGDLYDFFCIEPTQLCLVVADVSGKGAAAALFMARTKTPSARCRRCRGRRGSAEPHGSSRG